jgi:hypothetical protein
MPGGDLGDPDRLAVQLQPQRVGDRADGVLGGGVADPARVHLEAGDGAEVDDVGVRRRLQQRQERAGDAQQADHVGVEHHLPVAVVPLGDRVQAGGQAGVVDQQVGAAVPLGHGRPERLDRGRLGDVQRQRGGADLLGEGA